MSIRIETTIADEAAKHELVSALSSDTTPRCTCGEWSDSGPSVVRVLSNFHEHRALAILAALKAARIAVVELPEVSQEDLYHQYWISIAPNASIKYEYDGSWDSSEHVREFATALLAAADIAEASQ